MSLDYRKRDMERWAKEWVIRAAASSFCCITVPYSFGSQAPTPPLLLLFSHTPRHYSHNSSNFCLQNSRFFFFFFLLTKSKAAAYLQDGQYHIVVEISKRFAQKGDQVYVKSTTSRYCRQSHRFKTRILERVFYTFIRNVWLVELVVGFVRGRRRYGSH